MKRNKSGIYCIYSMVNNKRYIGSSCNLTKRKQNHRYDLKIGIHGNRLLQEDYNLYGPENFVYSDLEYCDGRILEEREKHWCLIFNTNHEDFGYNIIVPTTGRSIKEDNYNKIKIPKRKGSSIKYIVIKRKENLVIEEIGSDKVCGIVGCSLKKLYEMTGYWAKKGSVDYKLLKSYNDYIVIKKIDFDESFDYINYKKIPKPRKKKEKVKKEHIPYSERNIARKKIRLININTKEEIIVPSIKQAIREYKLVATKVNKLLNNPIGKYSHHGYYMEKL